MTARRKAFVVGAYVRHGGTFMAYHVGRILRAEFGFDLVAVTVGDETPGSSVFEYDQDIASMSVGEMEAAIGETDVLVCNPSFSHRMFGLRLPGIKVCYVQHFNTYDVLDCRFDLYVSVSTVVADFLAATYRIETEVIPAFIDLSAVPEPAPWAERPERSTLLYVKGSAAHQQPIIGRLRAILADRAPEIEIGENAACLTLAHADLMMLLGRHRHILTLTAAEGFGLVPLEAMGMGATVIGFDGLGGRDYMRDGINCAVAAYPGIESVADKLIAVTRQPELAACLARAGRTTARDFGYLPFRAAWTRQLARLLDRPSPAWRAGRGRMPTAPWPAEPLDRRTVASEPLP